MGELTGLERDILAFLLTDGGNAPKPIAEAVGSHRNSVSRSLSSLEDEELVVDKGSGVWTLSCIGTTAARAIYRDRQS